MFLRGSQPLWLGIVLLFGFMRSSNIVEGQTLAERKCNAYRKITHKKLSLIPLTLFPTRVEYEVSKCSNLVDLIAGGEQATYGEFPHHALLGYLQGFDAQYYFKCSGTLISEQHVMTAAHCFSELNPTVVRLGEYDTAYSNGEERDFYISAIRKHPLYKNSQLYHDIALVKLANRVYFSTFIRPACLWDTEYRNTSKYIASGFGGAEYGEFNTNKMMKVQLEEFSVEDCAELFISTRRFRGGIQDNQLCIGSDVEGRDTCQGDSGGPLQTVTDAASCIYHVVGITSIGSACGIGYARAIYTKVSHYIDWIEDNVWGADAM